LESGVSGRGLAWLESNACLEAVFHFCVFIGSEGVLENIIKINAIVHINKPDRMHWDLGVDECCGEGFKTPASSAARRDGPIFEIPCPGPTLKFRDKHWISPQQRTLVRMVPQPLEPLSFLQSFL
jgi:hypothetical protein